MNEELFGPHHFGFKSADGADLEFPDAGFYGFVAGLHYFVMEITAVFNVLDFLGTFNGLDQVDLIGNVHKGGARHVLPDIVHKTGAHGALVDKGNPAVGIILEFVHNHFTVIVAGKIARGHNGGTHAFLDAPHQPGRQTGAPFGLIFSVTEGGHAVILRKNGGNRIGMNGRYIRKPLDISAQIIIVVFNQEKVYFFLLHYIANGLPSPFKFRIGNGFYYSFFYQFMHHCLLWFRGLKKESIYWLKSLRRSSGAIGLSVLLSKFVNILKV